MAIATASWLGALAGANPAEHPLGPVECGSEYASSSLAHRSPHSIAAGLGPLGAGSKMDASRVGRAEFHTTPRLLVQRQLGTYLVALLPLHQSVDSKDLKRLPLCSHTQSLFHQWTSASRGNAKGSTDWVPQ